MKLAKVAFACAALIPVAALEGQQPGTLQVGEMAPDFTLKRHHSGETVTLSSLRGVKPVALIFGSYT